MHYSAAPPLIFTGNAHPGLASRICDYMGVKPGGVEVFKFSNDNTFVRILENIRQRDVFIVQPTTIPVNDSIMELLIMIDAAKRASAGRVTAVMPHYSYARTDKKDQPRVPITGRLVADLIKTAGADRAILFDLHTGQVQGFFSFPVDELTALPIQTNYFKSKKLNNPVVTATDIGISKRARDFALRLDLPLAIVEKRRTGNHGKVESLNLIGDVAGKTVLLFDDEINSGNTMIAAIGLLIERGAKSVYACATHGIFTGDCLRRMETMDAVLEIVTTDTIPQTANKGYKKLRILPVAPLIGEAIKRIHQGHSVGELFK